MGLKGRKTAIDKIYPRHFLATAKALKFPQEQMREILCEFAERMPAALDNVTAALPKDFPKNVAMAIRMNVFRLYARLNRETEE